MRLTNDTGKEEILKKQQLRNNEYYNTQEIQDDFTKRERRLYI